MDIAVIMNCLPHRYPFLLVDRVIEFEPDQSLIGLKNVTINEPYFIGHFPQQPIMPGVLIIEALAQATGILAFQSQQQRRQEEMYYLVGVDKARFKLPVVPGDQLHLEVTLQRVKRDIGVFTGRATVDGKLAASAELMCAKRPMLSTTPASGASAEAEGAGGK